MGVFRGFRIIRFIVNVVYVFLYFVFWFVLVLGGLDSEIYEVSLVVFLVVYKWFIIFFILGLEGVLFVNFFLFMEIVIDVYFYMFFLGEFFFFYILVRNYVIIIIFLLFVFNS